VKRAALPQATLTRWGEHLGTLGALQRVRKIGEMRAARLVREADSQRQARDAERDAAQTALHAAAALRTRAARQTEQALRRGVSGGWQVLGFHAQVDRLAVVQRDKDNALIQARAAAEAARQTLRASQQRWWREQQRGETLQDVHRQAHGADQARREWIAEEDQP
jgi:hypothetical protein